MIKLYLFLENRERIRRKTMKFDKSPNLKYQAITVNSAKENCGNPQKSYVESTKVLFLQKKNAEIRNNLSCYDYK